MHFRYKTTMTCSSEINFEISDGKVSDIVFTGGCNGNLKAISKLVDGWDARDIEAKLLGNTCRQRPTSCADQLAKAVRLAYDAEMKENGN